MTDKKKSDYEKELKQWFEKNDSKIILDAAMRIKELENEIDKLQSAATKVENTKWAWWNNTSYIATLIFIGTLLTIGLYSFFSYKNFSHQQTVNQISELNTKLVQLKKDCNCTQP